MLGDGVRGGADPGEKSGRRSGADEVALTALEPLRYQQPCRTDMGPQIDVDRAVPVPLTHVEAERAADTRVREVEIDRTEGALRQVDQLLDLLGVRHVRAGADGASRMTGVDFLRHRPRGLRVEVRDDDPGTRASEPRDQRAADAATPTGDDGDALCNVHGNPLP